MPLMLMGGTWGLPGGGGLVARCATCEPRCCSAACSVPETGTGRPGDSGMLDRSAVLCTSVGDESMMLLDDWRLLSFCGRCILAGDGFGALGSRCSSDVHSLQHYRAHKFCQSA